MKSAETTINETDERRSGSPRRGRRAAIAIGLTAAVTMAGCTSDPGPRRVAQDIIKAEALENPNLDEECMLEALKGFTDGELEDISKQLGSDNEGTRAEGQAALDDFEAALDACN